MNICALIGNAASDPELKTTAGGKSVCHFRLAVSRAGADTADFFDVVTWDRQAEIIAEYVSIGRRVGVEGRLQHRTWETENGERRSKVELVANRVHLLGNRAQSAVAAPRISESTDESPFG